MRSKYTWIILLVAIVAAVVFYRIREKKREKWDAAIEQGKFDAKMLKIKGDLERLKDSLKLEKSMDSIRQLYKNR